MPSARRSLTAGAVDPGTARARVIFVAAMFDAYFTTYQAAIADLIRIATAGTGQLPPGALHPDLVARVAARRGTRRSGC